MPKKHTLPLDPRNEILLRLKGSLPEIVNNEDLPKLNEGLRLLFKDLRSALKLFNAPDQNDRQGTILAVITMLQFILLFKPTIDEGLQIPVLKLVEALFALESGTVTPLLKPPVKSGRTPSSPGQNALIGYAVAAVEQLEKTGLTRKDARVKVAKSLNRLNIRPSRGRREITETTLRHWTDEVAADVERTGHAAMVHDWVMRPEYVIQASTPPAPERRTFVIKSLENIIEQLHLNNQKPS